MRRFLQALLCTMTLCTLSGCEADNMYSSHYCNFVFLAYLYPSSALTKAAASTGGDFCIVKAVVQNGVTHLKLTPNRGTYADADLDLVMRTAIGNERLSYASMGYRQGLVIGRSAYGVLRAYDLQCPNCDFNYELSWGEHTWQMVCRKCHRVYNIDGNYGYVESGEKGKALELYGNSNLVTVNGQQRLVVRN